MHKTTRPSNRTEGDRTKEEQGRALASDARVDRMARIDRRKRAPLGRQIYERVRKAIDTGVLAPGARVASARALASELGVARGTVEAAYQRLAGEGYLLARGPAGTFVSPNLPHAPRGGRVEAAVGSASAAGLVNVNKPAAMFVAPAPMPLQLGIPALDAFPRKLWLRLAARRVRTTLPADLNYGDPCGEPALRQAIAAYLHVSRGVACDAGQVFVTTGYRASLALAAGVLLERGDSVWIEDPCYPPTRAVLERASLIAAPVPVDEEGMAVAEGARRAPRARMAVVTPSHQAPLCVSMTAARRLALLDWASRAKAWVLEDDYDGEFNYAGPTLPALKSLDADDRVIYAGSFSKVLFPSLSLGYLVVPKAVAARFAKAMEAGPSRSPRMDQIIVADFLAGGHFARHLKKMRLLYGRRRAWFADALHEAFGDRVHVDQARGGMHLVVRVLAKAGDRTLARRAQRDGLNCQPLSERHEAPGRRDQALLMGFTNIATAGEARQIARRLHGAFERD